MFVCLLASFVCACMKAIGGNDEPHTKVSVKLVFTSIDEHVCLSLLIHLMLLLYVCMACQTQTLKCVGMDVGIMCFCIARRLKCTIGS